MNAVQLETISKPSALLPGQVIVRVSARCERVYQEWKVIAWIAPLRPSPGQAWSSGFLRCISLEDGERRDFGPASLVRKDFRQLAKASSVSVQSQNKPSRKTYWWERD